LTVDKIAPRVLILWADVSSPNFGVQALALGARQAIKIANPECVVEFLSHKSVVSAGGITRKDLLLSFVRPRGSLMNYLGNFDLILDMGEGDSFSEIYGLQRLLMLAATKYLAAREGVALVLGPQTFGPFTSSLSKMIAKWSARRALEVFVRDSASEQAASSLNVGASLSTDVVFLLGRPLQPATARILVNVSGLIWAGAVQGIPAAKYRRECLALIESLLAHGRDVSLLVHVAGGDALDNDRHAAEAIRAELDVEVMEPKDVLEAREVIAGSAAVIGARMHACLNALSLGIPAFPWAYSRKFEPLFLDLGWTPLIDLRTEAHPAAATLELLALLPTWASSAAAVPDRAIELNAVFLRALTRRLG
jgi:colanic acid/amylovoran biosynthesis protein